MISHDRHLIDACAERLWIVRDGTVSAFAGDIDDYRQTLLDEMTQARRRRDGEAGSETERAKTDRASQRRAAAERRAALAPLRKSMTNAEKAVGDLTAKLAEIDTLLGDADLYTREPERAQNLLKQRGTVARELELAETEWMNAMETYEQAAHQLQP